MELFNKYVMALDGMRRSLGFLMATAVIDALLVVGQALSLSWVLSQLWLQVGAAAHADADGVAALLVALAPYIAVFACCYLVRQVVAFARSKVMDSAAQRGTEQLLREYMQVVFSNGPAFVQRFRSGSVTATAVEGMDRIKIYIELSLPKSTDLMVVSAVLALALLVLDWVSGIIAIVTIPCIIMFMRLLGENSKRAAADQHGEYERLTNHFSDTLRGFPTIKLFGRSSAYEQRVYERSEGLRKATVKTLKTVTLSSLVLDLFRTFALAAVAIMLGFRLMAGDVELFRALAVLVIVPELYAAIRRYSADFHATLEGKNQMAAVASMLKEGGSHLFDGVEADGGEAGDSAEVPPGCHPERSAEHGVEGSPATIAAPADALRVSNVSFTYHTDDEARTVLSDASFAVPRACKVGIVGASGAGKSTLVNLLAGFASPDEGGMFTVDGKVMPTLADPAWQRRVTYIPQHPHLFSATLRENIAFYCPDATPQAVEQAVDTVGLRALADELPQGLETVVGQGGRQLSGGQAQRVALARAFLDSQRDVWLLDEPTAHLDVETELALKESMLPLMEGKLVFFATHRLHWMRSMDLLVVLQEGRVVQVGTYEELSSQPGAFAELSRSLQRGWLA